MKRITLLMLMVVLLLPIAIKVQAQSEPPMKFFFGGNFNLQANTGGAEVNFAYNLEGNFFLLASIEVDQAISGVDVDGYGKMYSGASLLGFEILGPSGLVKSNNFSLSVLGGQATQIYAFLYPSTTLKIAEKINRTYVELYGGAMFTWTPGGDGLSLYISGQGVTPIKDVVIDTDYNVSVGVAVPFGT